jgi:photosystem II stability/assembly factor-like uncharacterized protein
MLSRPTALSTAALFLSCAAACAAAAGKPTDSPEPGSDAPDVLKGLALRNIGPAVAGGRVTSVVGLPGNPNVYYAGAAAGGVWKTTDGGGTWSDIFKQEATGSIGAIAVAPSNPSVIWVGTGEGNPRNDVVDGAGVYVSTDDGKSWRLAGLADAGQVTQILVDPSDPMSVFVAALGHVWGPNAERGVFHTADGGKSWKKALFVDDTTGCADLQAQPGNPMVLIAAMWQFRRYPWKLESGGPGSALYRSVDGGQTWKKIVKGLPKGPLGRCAVAFAPGNPQHVYALVEAKEGMLWESENLGDDWKKVSDSHALNVRPFYFSKFVVAPDDDRHLYFCSFELMESSDGGKTTRSLDHRVHPDHHAIWIDPKDPRRIIQGNDGGVYTSHDGGQSWRYLDNLPIGQFYMVAADSAKPYGLCGGLQDNNAWCGAANSLSRAGITGSDWWVVAGGDGEYAVPAPSDPDVIYCESQNGSILRFDRKTKFSSFVRPYLATTEQMRPAELKYRFNWTTPIAVSVRDANTVYVGGNVVFGSTDGGKQWTPISEDLTRDDKTKQESSGGDIEYDISGAETYDTILTVNLAPSDEKVLWVGTDDGLVQVTRDGGKTWQEVSRNIPRAPAWARVYQIGVSSSDPGTAIVALDAHELDDRHAYVYQTTDFGRTWKSIGAGLPEVPVIVVREDPGRKGFLVAGTMAGLFFSPDGGRQWEKLKSNFPTSPVFDVKFVEGDLVVATHGRGIFVLDGVRTLEELGSSRGKDFSLFPPSPGTEWHMWNSRGFSAAGYTAPNPPNGVAIDYFLSKETEATPEQKKKKEGPVEIRITDSNGKLVARGFGPSKEGVNRYVWNMRHEKPTPLDFEKEGESELGEFFERGAGPRVLAGTYTAEISVGGKSEKTAVVVRNDPRFHIDASVFRAQEEVALKVRDEISAANQMLNRLTAWNKQLEDFDHSLPQVTQEQKAVRARYESVLAQGKKLRENLSALKDSVYNSKVQTDVPEDDIHHLQAFHDELDDVMRGISFAYDQPPSALRLDQLAALRKTLDEKLAEFNKLRETAVPAYNKAAYEVGAPTLYVGDPIAVGGSGAASASGGVSRKSGP